MINSGMMILNAAAILAAVILNLANKGFTPKKWKYQLFTVLIVSPLFWVPAVLFVKLELIPYAGAEYAALFGVPLYYWLYLPAIAFLSVSILELIKKLTVEKVTLLPRLFFLFPAAVFIIPAVVFYSRTYTFIILLSAAAFFLFTGAVKHRLIQSGRFMTALAAGFVLLSILEIIRAQLTAAIYTETGTWGISVLNTPLENLIFAFSISGFSLAVYSLLSWKLQYERQGDR